MCVGGSSSPGLFGDDSHFNSACNRCFTLWSATRKVRTFPSFQMRDGKFTCFTVIILFTGDLSSTGLIHSSLWLSKVFQVWEWPSFALSSFSSAKKTKQKSDLSFHSAVAAIFTGLALIGESEDDEWMLKVMGGFVAWEALMYVLQDLHKRSKKKGKREQNFTLRISVFQQK